jgi:hypothetical protein
VPTAEVVPRWPHSAAHILHVQETEPLKHQS